MCLLGAARISAEDSGELPGLWVDLSMGAPLVDLFNERAHSDDIARVEHISQLDVLGGVITGKRLVVFKAAADAMRLIPHIHEEVDIVGYNLEHGPANPIFEQENPVESIRRLREMTDRYGLELALGPDRRFAESDGPEMAPYADYFILQVQKVQTDPDTVYEFVEPLIRDIRRANPEIEISLQIRTEGDVDDLIELLTPLQGTIQGVSILTSEETLQVTEEIMARLRPSARVLPPTATVVATAAPVASILTPQPRVTRSADTAHETVQESEAEPVQEPSALATEIESEALATERSGSTALLIVVALVVGFALGAGYVSHRTGS